MLCQCASNAAPCEQGAVKKAFRFASKWYSIQSHHPSIIVKHSSINMLSRSRFQHTVIKVLANPYTILTEEGFKQLECLLHYFRSKRK